MKRRKKRRAVTRPDSKPSLSRKKKRVGKPHVQPKQKRVRKSYGKPKRKIVAKKTRRIDRKKSTSKKSIGKRSKKSSLKRKRIRQTKPRKKPVRPVRKVKGKKKLPVRKLKKPKIRVGYPEGVVEGERYTTPKLKYEYREFNLPDYEPETIAGVIEEVLKEPKPHPIAFYIHLEYADKDGTTGDVGTGFFRFRVDNADDASEACVVLASQYEIDSVTEIEMLATYSIV